MNISLHIIFLYCAMAFVSLIVINESVAADANYACGGNVEAEVWEAWDGNVRDYLRQSQLDARLLKQVTCMRSMIFKPTRTTWYPWPAAAAGTID